MHRQNFIAAALFKQLTNNISFTRNFAKNIDRLKSFNLSFGAEWRFENYQIKKGEEASYEKLRYYE